MNPERRRDADRDRRRWNDTALDQLEVRVGDVEDVGTTVAGLPDQVLGLKDAVEQLRLAHRDAASLEERRVASMRADIGKLHDLIEKRFDVVDQAHARQKGVDWKTVLAVAATIVVPIVVAIIALIASQS